ncbi:MAG: hypothetical protein FJ150_09870 [Euryarchaeota archaeon]|nr:hypothetical protein [Euryarchaeota archaeon]
MNKCILDYLSKIEFGETQEFKEMIIVPVFISIDQQLEYLTMKEALDQDLILITEVEDKGSVPELKVINNAKIPVLLLDGEEIIGAKQNRVLNTTILLKERSETIIPVSCTEQGRWFYTTKNFSDSENIAAARIRRTKAASVKNSLRSSGRYSSDQHAIWSDIKNMAEEAGFRSNTDAMSDVFEYKSRDLDEYLEGFEVVDGQQGLLVVINGKIVGFDIISNKSAYKILHPKLIKSYGLDAYLQKNEGNNKNTEDDPKRFIEDIMQSVESRHKSVGYGWDYRFNNEKFVGSALVYKKNVIHTAFFRASEIEEKIENRMARYSRRRRFRD